MDDSLIDAFAEAHAAHAADLDRLGELDADQVDYLAEGHLVVEDDDPDYLGECGGL